MGNTIDWRTGAVAELTLPVVPPTVGSAALVHSAGMVGTGGHSSELKPAADCNRPEAVGGGAVAESADEVMPPTVRLRAGGYSAGVGTPQSHLAEAEPPADRHWREPASLGAVA